MKFLVVSFAMVCVTSTVIAQWESPDALERPDMIADIIRGTDVATNRPYLVSIQVEERMAKQHLCGGSLITPNKILSAAHCLEVWEKPGFEYYAKLGFLTITQGYEDGDGDGKQTIKITSMVKHPNYKPRTGGEHFDVVIFTLEKEAQLVPGKVELVKRSSKTVADLQGKMVQLDGWGATSPQGRASEKLQHLELQVVADSECEKTYRPGWILKEQHICAISPASGDKPDSCRGDSGSPLMFEGEQVGIVSFGWPECGTNKPSVYGNVAFFKSFIDSNI